MPTHILDPHAEPDLGRRLHTAEEVARNAGLLSVADTIREVASPQRRALLLGAAALAGGAAANAAAIVTSRAAEGADAELFDLSRELDELIVVIREERQADARHADAREAACVRAGLPSRELKDFPGYDEFVEYNRARGRVDAGDGYVEYDDSEGLDELVEQILSCTARTKDGLAIQARAWQIGDEQMFDGTGIDNQSVFGERFLDAVCRHLQIERVDVTRLFGREA